MTDFQLISITEKNIKLFNGAGYYYWLEILIFIGYLKIMGLYQTKAIFENPNMWNSRIFFYKLFLWTSLNEKEKKNNLNAIGKAWKKQEIKLMRRNWLFTDIKSHGQKRVKLHLTFNIIEKREKRSRVNKNTKVYSLHFGQPCIKTDTKVLGL